MDRIIEFDTVRIVALFGSAESHLAIRDAREMPAVGDEGAVVHLLPTSDPDAPETRYLVEKVRADGTTDWLAEFGREELVVVRHP